MRQYRYPMSAIIGLDHFVNSLFGGSPYETISSRVGRNAIKGEPLALVLEVVINALIFWRPNHCRAAIGS